MSNQQQNNMIQNSPIYHKTVSSSFQKLQKAASEGKFRVKSFRVKTTDNDLEQHLATKLGLPTIFPNQSSNKMISSSLLAKLQPVGNFDIDIAKSRSKSFKILQKNYEQQLNQMGLLTNFLVKLFEIKSEEGQTKCSEQRYQVFLKSLFIRIKGNKLLSISQMGMGPKALTFFFKWFISWQGHVSELDLSYPGEYLKEHKVQTFKKLLEEDNKLLGLTLCNSGLNGDEMQNILKAVVQKQQLEKLDLSNSTSQSLNRFGDEMNILQDFAASNESVSTLKLNNLQLRRQGFQFICKGIGKRKITPLQVLSISDNYISGVKISQYFYTLLRSGLTHLNISCNPLGIQFYKALPNLRATTIKQLDLRQTLTTSECLYDFLEKIEESKSLTVLRLDGNDFSHHWFAKIGQKLSTNTSLEWISFNNCQIKTFIPIFQGLQFNKYLKRLDASENSVNCETELLKKIGDCFLQNKNLQEFRIKFCGLNEETLIKIFEGVAKNRKLKVIDISQNLLEDNGARAILKMLDENSFIENIGMEKLQITYPMRKQIESKLHDNKEIREKLQFKHLKQLNMELKSKDCYTQEDIQHYEIEEKALGKTLKKLEEKVKQLQTVLKKKKDKVIELVKKCKEEESAMEKNTQQKIRFENEKISLIDRENRKLEQMQLKCKQDKEREMDMIRKLEEKIRLENEHIKKRENQLQDSLRDHMYKIKKKKACLSQSLPGVLFKK